MQWAELNSTGLYFTVLASGSVRLIKSEPLSLRLDMTRLDWTSVVGAGGTIQYNTTHSSSPLILILMPVMGYREFLLFTSILSCNAPVWLHQEEQRREKKGREEGVNTFERTEQNRTEQSRTEAPSFERNKRKEQDGTGRYIIPPYILCILSTVPYNSLYTTPASVCLMLYVSQNPYPSMYLILSSVTISLFTYLTRLHRRGKERKEKREQTSMSAGDMRGTS